MTSPQTMTTSRRKAWKTRVERYGPKGHGEFKPERKGAAKRPSKYGNVKTTIGGEKFDSKREALRHLVLKQRERDGEIRGLVRQPRWPLKVNGKLICTYVGDWEYEEDIGPTWNTGIRAPAWRRVVDDSKGHQTRDFRIKWKLCKALHPEIEWRLS